MRSGATISDVADAAGVSRATVSRVMNGGKVDPELTRRVRAAAARLSYRPSVTARSLSLGRTAAVGIVVPDLTNPMFQTVLRSVAAGAYDSGYSVVVAESAGRFDREAEIARSTRARTDALVLVSPRVGADELGELLADIEPVVMVNRSLPGSDIPAVSVDYSSGMVTVLEHLVGLGHRQVVYLTGPERSPSNIARLDGLGRVARAVGDVRITTLPCGADLSDGYRLAHAVLATRATAVVAYNDKVAFGLLAHLHELGVDVPAELSVVGFDDIELASYATPALTTVHVPYEAIGRRAWERLHERVVPRPADAAAETGGTEILPVHFVERLSTRRLAAPDGEPSARADVTSDAATV